MSQATTRMTPPICVSAVRATNSTAAVSRTICGRSQQTQFPQLAAHRLRHVLRARRGAFQIGRRVLHFEVAPTLERAPWPRLDRHNLGLEHELAAADAAFLDLGAHGDERLSPATPPPRH